MKKSNWARRTVTGLLALTVPVSLVAAGNPAFAKGRPPKGGTTTNPVTASAYSGRAVVARASLSAAGLLSQTTSVSDTGPLPSSGGALERSLLEVAAGVNAGAFALRVNGDVAHAATVGHGNRSSAEASLAEADVMLTDSLGLVKLVELKAGLLMARARAQCSGTSPSTWGSSDLVELTVLIAGKPVTLYVDANVLNNVALDIDATVSIGLLSAVKIHVQLVTNEVVKTKDSITVRAAHLRISGGITADVVLSEAHADIACNGGAGGGCPAGDFVTGGGFISANGAKDTFAVAGGYRNGAGWGHLEYIDHGTGMNVHGTGVLFYGPGVDANTRVIKGTARINGSGSFPYTVTVGDNGEPGQGTDYFRIDVNGYTAAGTLGGGNIQLHKPNCN